MIRLGILGGADIAYRMFLPAIKKLDNIKCVCIASKNRETREKFRKDFGIPVVPSYEEIINNLDIDAVYVPLPPAMHYKWGKLALEKGKHVFLEKPSTTDFIYTKELVDLADQNNLALHENYMFEFHSQLKEIQDILDSGRIGKVRLYRCSFGFPKRQENDFRYSKALGGGALMDAGGYVVKLATLLLGDSIKVCAIQKQADLNYEVDIFDSVMFSNKDGMSFQGSFGMDCQYQCSLEVWGSIGKLSTNRIFTAPSDFEPTVIIENKNAQEIIKLSADMQFKHSIEVFVRAIENMGVRSHIKENMLLQSKLVSELKNLVERVND